MMTNGGPAEKQHTGITFVPPEFDQVWNDLLAAIGDGATFLTLDRARPNSFRWLVPGDSIELQTIKRRPVVLPRALLESAWHALYRCGALAPADLPRKRHSTAVMTLLAQLPYVKHVGPMQICIQGRRSSGINHFSEQESETAASGELSPLNSSQAQMQLYKSIVERRGEPEFRQTLLQAYNYRCAVSDCDAVDVLEAAYIVAYNGDQTRDVTKGLLLRADIHTLFDLGLLDIETATLTVRLHPSLKHTSYAHLEGKPLRLPADRSLRPSTVALDQRRTWYTENRSSQ